MGLLIIPIFLLSIVYIILGFHRVSDRRQLSLIVLLGAVIIAISIPLVVVLLDGFTAGFIENQMSGVWILAKKLTIADGDIYVGAGGLLVVISSTILLILQMLLARKHGTG